jgi:aspartate racemase
MKTFGLSGGMTYPSITLYYTAINDIACARLGGSHSAPLLLYSFDFDVLSRLIPANNRQAAAVLLIDAAKKLESIGAEGLTICANVMHKVSNDIAAVINVPVLHAMDAIGSKLKVTGIRQVALLATKVLIESDICLKPLERFELDVLVPEPEETEWVNYIIFEELGKGIVSQESRRKLLKILDGLRRKGVEACVLACTDLAPLLANDEKDNKEMVIQGVRVFDSTVVHAKFIAEWALAKNV